MNCPACGSMLEKVYVKDVELDVCKQGCAGIWFDANELKKMDEQHEYAGEELLSLEADPSVKVDYGARRPCPKCDGVIMMRHYMSVKKEVEVDECAACAGIFLDGGELQQIRNQFKTETDRHAAFNQYFDRVLGAEVAEREAENEAQLEKCRRFASAFRFICPSYYIPGKQAGGAF